jgi:O-antigen/teichoic acid export membrane protein
MKPSTRIIVNTLATYGRSLFALVVSLFSARWILLALGQTDFGLYGVVGSLITLITFLNGAMTVGVARFYAYSIGSGHNLSEEEATVELKRWFNTAVSIHSALPILLVLIGYPLGIHAIENWLTIPADRMDACIWVFRISLITGVVNVFSVPFISMYTAHQLISELALFDIIRSFGTFFGAYFLLHVQSDRLVVYAVYMMSISAGIPLLQVLRAVLKFKACRINAAYMYDMEYLKKLFGFVGWKMFGMGCVVSRTQGSPILINLFFGPQVNAAFSIANRVSIQATMLSTAMMGAFQPAITSMEGRGDRTKMLATALQVCKFSTLLILFFVIPLMLEMEYVLKVWLETPPAYSGVLCQWMLAMLLVDRITSGHMLAVNAYGKIALYELVQGSLLFLAVPLAWLFFKQGGAPIGMGYALFMTMVLYCCGRLVFCKALLQLPILSWVRQVAVPIIVLMVCSGLIGLGISSIVDEGFGRFCLTTIATGICSALMGWLYVLSKTERAFTRIMIKKMVTKFRLFS